MGKHIAYHRRDAAPLAAKWETLPMIIGIPRESHAGETRVAATPQTVGQLIKLGYSVVVESGAGDASSFTDAAYVEAGADIGDAWAADVVLKVNAPSDVEIAALRDGATLVSLISPALNPELVEKLSARPITALAMDAVPRISRAQSLDVLSSMANIAGYRAVVEAAHVFGRFFTGQVTAAGKVPPAKVLVAGAGVAGLAAIGAAGSLGAIVRATDPRPEVADQVKSLGGEYLSVDGGGRGVGHRLRQGDGRGLQGPRGGAVRRAGQGRRHHHHHRADPRPARAPPDHRGDGRLDEAGQRDRRHGRGQRRQRRGHRHGSGDRHRQRRDDHRLHRPGRAAAGAGLAAVRHQPGEPAEAADPGQGRAARPRLRRRRAAVDDRGARRRDDLAAAAGAGVGRARGRRRPRRSRRSAPSSRCRRSADWASRSSPPRCCSCSSRCPRPRCRST